MELSVGASLFDSDSKEEAIFHLKLVGSGENHPSVNLPFKKGGGAENIQLATGLHPWDIEQRGVLIKDSLYSSCQESHGTYLSVVKVEWLDVVSSMAERLAKVLGHKQFHFLIFSVMNKEPPWEEWDLHTCQ